MNITTDAQGILYRTIAIYLAEAAIGLVLFFMFLYFARIYKRKFLTIWAYSWLALIVFMLTTIWITLNNIGSSSGYQRFFISILSMAACFAQMALILMGTYSLLKERVFPLKHLLLFLIGILAFSFIVILFKNEVEGAAKVRYLVRIGLKYGLVGVGFVWAGFVFFFNRNFTRGLGQKIFSFSLIGIGLTDLYYSTIAISVYFGFNLGFPFFFGLLEFVFTSFIGIGMVTWLLEDERTKLTKTNREMDSFLYSTSHDLRAPIASILGLANLAKMELRDETALKYFEMVENRVKKMDSVISDILQVARGAKADLKFEQIDFNKLLQEIIADVKFNKGAKAIHLRYTPDPAFVLHSDYIQLKIIFGNLISNAVKYHFVEQTDPFIAVRFVRANDEVTIEVEDNGTGIAKEYQEKIFNMFFRASTQSEGTGLGLYIVAEAVAKLQGKITVRSEVGKGSTFAVRLPII
jgi:signal transduction histidine kinase